MRRKKTTLFNVICNQPYDCNSRMKLYCSSKASVQLIQRMSLLKRLGVHNGCVNSICWNSTGDLILSGSDDQHLVLTNIYNYKVLTDYKTSHRANIFSAKFLPNNGDHRIVSCSGDGIILYTDLLRTSETFHNQFSCHNGTAYEIETMPGEPHSFLSCGEDCTVRYFDLRVKSSCNTPRCKEDVLIFRQRAITAMSVNPMMPHYLAIGCADSSVGIYDRRMLSIDCSGVNSDTSTRAISMFTVPEFEGHPYRISSLNYSPDGNDILVSYSSDHIYLFSAKDQGSMRLKKEAAVEKNKNKRPPVRSPQPVRRLRLRGDWSDTGPDARPEREGGRRNGAEIAQARPVLHTSLMQRMTDVLSRMLNDPATRAALSGGGEDSIQGVIAEVQQGGDNNVDRATEEQAMETEASHQQVQENENAESNITEDHALGTFEPAFSVIDHDGGSVNNASIDCAEDNATAAQEETACPDESSQFEEAIHSPMSPSVSCEKNDREMADSGSDTPPNIENVRDDSMMENLQDRLTSMRDGFLERHGSEPAVSLTYSDKSSTGATISLGVANEVIRDSYHPGPSGSQTLSKSSASTNSNVSHNHKIGYSEICENVDDEVYSDSDDEEMLPNRRVEKPLDTEMEETMLTNKQVPFSHSESFTTNPFTDLHVRQKYMGHRNARTMIKEANFWGNDFVMSGSDCGHVFVWDRETAKLCMLLEADQHVVNCIQPHPYLPILATSGIDYDVKLWAPINEEANFDVNFAEDLQKRNAVMLEETKDTITVPAVFMIRMLACLNQIRRGRGRNRRRSGDEGDELRGG